jgi:hypothetical protein
MSIQPIDAVTKLGSRGRTDTLADVIPHTWEAISSWQSGLVALDVGTNDALPPTATADVLEHQISKLLSDETIHCCR